MPTSPRLLALILLAVSSLLLYSAKTSGAETSIESPDGELQVGVQLSKSGEASCKVTFRNKQIATVELGLQFAGQVPLAKDLQIINTRQESFDETYTIAVGKASSARDHYNELIVSLKERQAPERRFDVALRAYDDGVAFRYLVPKLDSSDELLLTEELTRLQFPGDPLAHILPLDSYTTPYEKYYEDLPVSAVGPDRLVGLPMLLEGAKDDEQFPWIAVTEANLTNYAGMYLAGVEGKPGTLAAKLSPLPDRRDGAKVVVKTPFTSPWRVLMIGSDPGKLIESNLVFNLNEPSAIKDTSWIKPGRTTFPWWNGYVLEGVDFEPGVNTATMKYYIDFCAENEIEYHSLDGLDIAWYGGPIQPDGPTDVTTAAESIDMPELLRYANEKGVRLRLWMHWKALQPQLDEAFQKYEEWGIEGVMIDFMDRDDQEMVNWYHEVAEKAAKHHLTVNWHGAYKPTGMERTWPNVFNYEAALNQEYNKWDPIGTPPEHNLNIAFIRTIAGPVDYHSGGMRNVMPEDHKVKNEAPDVQGTRCHQLAMYVLYPNPLPMLADYPSAYRSQPGFEFIASIPTSWDETKVLHADFGVGLIVARRKGDSWYLGGMTGKEECHVEVPLEFLGEGSFEIEATYDNPAKGSQAVTTLLQSVSAGETFPIAMTRGGGFVAKIRRLPDDGVVRSGNKRKE